MTASPVPDSGPGSEPWDDHDDGFDPGYSPPEGWEVMSDAQRREFLGDDGYPEGFYAEEPGEDGFADLVEAGFTHRYPVPGATGFRAGGPLDQMLPGGDLAWHVGAARQRGLGELSDDELIGFLGAARRGESWQAALVLAATAELDARRAAPDGREGEHVADELATALTLTGRGAQDQLELSRQLERLPHTGGLLAAGVIDRSRAAVIVRHLSLLNDADAGAVDGVIAAVAGGKTTGELGARCHRAVVAHDPLAYIRRKQQAEQDARVECWTEDTGTAAMAGRDLDRALTIAADKSLDQAARWLQRNGVPGTLDQLRAGAFLARLAARPLHTLLPAPPAAPGTPAAPRTPPTPGDPVDPRTWPPAFGGPGTPAPGTPAPGDPVPGDPVPGDPAPADPGGPAPGGPSWINLTVPLTTMLGLTDHPGEISGTGAAGPADAGTCRTLADSLARSPAARWCVTVTDRTGRPVAHGCARAGPGPPGTDRRAWLATVTITPIETGTCAHRHESAGYQPAPTLRHRVKIRSPRCGFPGCRRPARRCDDDHTIPHHKGGRTCECNLYP